MKTSAAFVLVIPPDRLEGTQRDADGHRWFGEASDRPRMMRKGTLFGFLDDEGKVAIPPRFQSVRDSRGGRAVFYDARKYGFVDKKGIVVIEAKFDSVADFSEGLAAVRVGERSGFLQASRKAAGKTSTRAEKSSGSLPIEATTGTIEEGL